MDLYRFVYHIITGKGGSYVLYGGPQSRFKSMADAIADGALAKALSRTVVLIEDYGVKNNRLRLMSFNQYNIDSIEITLEAW